ncbi:fused MFS/spermidine synthase [Schaalia sp. ZJ1691]|uniref:spermidine synthase n=1 Tax=Schaalia sp. ZJ1691 TaxID=2709404 RepID=UPI0013EAA3D7|nr:fused MFS/spermidine synthase [Schaalia sp. ZJ1691]
MTRKRTRGSEEFLVDNATASIRWDGSRATLFLDGIESSSIDVDDPTYLEFEYMQHMTCVVDSVFPDHAIRAIHLGGAACALATAWAHSRPGSRQTAIEIDGALAREVRQRFSLPPSPDLRIRVGDAREVLGTLRPSSADVIVRDAFFHGAVPPALRTLECAREAYEVLRPGGLYLVNCAHGGQENARIDIAALRDVFDEVVSIQDPKVGRSGRRGNIVAIAVKDRLDGDENEPVLHCDDVDRRLRRLPLPARITDSDSLNKWIAGHKPLSDALVGWPQPAASPSLTS